VALATAIMLRTGYAPTTYRHEEKGPADG